MRGGLDRHAFKAELRALGREDRRRYMRIFGEWVRASGQPHKATTYVGIAISGIAVATTLASFYAGSHARGFLAAGLTLMFVGQMINWRVIREAQRWREQHPFEQWRHSAHI